MSAPPRSLLQALALSCLLLPSTARVIWIPEEFDPLIESSLLTARQAPTCGGDASLSQCGADFPDDFCCPSGTVCLALQTDPSITATMCCPAGQNCNTIGPVSCDQSFQNATLVPASQLHSEPTMELETCGENCCPMGYRCEGKNCVASPSKATASSSATGAAATSSSTSESSSSSAAPSAHGSGIVIADPQETKTPDIFNSKSFAAGFVPGLAIGALIAACLIFLLLRKRSKSSSSYSDEKGNRDTLTDLSASPDDRPTMHGRSISEPVVDPRFGNRNDFLRGSPPRAPTAPLGNNVDIHSDAPAPSRTPRIKALFSHSPFMAPSTPSTPPTAPVPAHLKRGTLSFKISPVRALKKQKSMHSLRRQMTDASSRGPKLDRSDSQETILVQFPNGHQPYTPNRQRAKHESSGTWISDSVASEGEEDDTPDERAAAPHTYRPAPLASSTRPAHTTPTRPPVHPPPPGALGSPYTPTNQVIGRGGNGGLLGAELSTVPDTRRDTTFSAMMERAGLRRSDLMPPVPPVPKGRR